MWCDDGPVYDAIVLAGGAGRRLGGVDKAALDIGGRSLLDRALRTVSAAQHVVVVGPQRALPSGVICTQERPPGGGPVAALEAGLAYVTAPLAAVLACDMPFVTRASMRELRGALSMSPEASYDGALLVDESGQRQSLAAIYRTDRLRLVLTELAPTGGTPMRAVLAGLRMLEVAANTGQTWDCDTWADVGRARRHAVTHFEEEA